ncbi:helical backbone metal receptor [Reichenbachiella sp. MSK19-1]|uniref:helical backbone metal receptor n=1 Tax=Reichenbachiella sp. MSK19-1 TaxID=1897631 RepID=UPI000E6CD9E1|nr:helical backbone metal receptor [Reichenbachiella sp. MSK19-1]RJE73879.1 cobalamin-binding protein [Reichenbachiella sp. MSK19-1]
MPQYKDQLDRTVTLPELPQRIISLVPSLTELLYDLGVGDRVVGITKFCIHPESWRKTKTRIGGTKQLKHDVIVSLAPDLILANKEENTREDVEALIPHYPVWVSDINDLSEVLEMIRTVGEATGSLSRAVSLADEIQTSFQSLPQTKSQRVLYLIWQNPWMTVGRDTFIDDMLQRCGYENVVTANRYPILTDEEIVALRPEVVMLSSEPFPFGDQHAERIQTLLPDSQVLLVDGEMFSWYGSRLCLSVAYFSRLINRITRPS